LVDIRFDVPQVVIIFFNRRIINQRSKLALTKLRLAMMLIAIQIAKSSIAR